MDLIKHAARSERTGWHVVYIVWDLRRHDILTTLEALLSLNMKQAANSAWTAGVLTWSRIAEVERGKMADGLNDGSLERARCLRCTLHKSDDVRLGFLGEWLVCG